MGNPYTDKAYRWNRDNYSRQRRYIDIWTFVLRLMGARWLYTKSWSYREGMTDAKKALRRQALAIWIRETLLDLGPTFIKVGQLFSTRADLFAVEFVEELSKLQDRVPAFSYEQVEAIITEELGKPVQELYRSFDPIPMAAASLGQVHRAQLHSGESVVVKVQRPGIERYGAPVGGEMGLGAWQGGRAGMRARAEMCPLTTARSGAPSWSKSARTVPKPWPRRTA